MKKYSKVLSFTLFLSLFLILPTVSLAAGENLDSVIVQVNETTCVKVSLSEYGLAFVLKDSSNLYNYLKGNNLSPEIVAVASGDKYMSIGEYGLQFVLNSKSASQAIEKSQPLPAETVKTFQEFKGFDENGNEILEPVIPEEPSEPTATVTITPDSLLKDGFQLANVKVDVSGIEGADRYSITYSVYDEAGSEKTVTTKLAKAGQVNPDLIQYIAGETEIIVNLFDANNKPISTEFKTTIK